MKLLARLLLACAALSASTAHAADDAKAALSRFIDGVQTLSANFTQVQTDDHGKVLGTTAGRVALARPGKFRWTYETPYQQLIVCDGKKVWLYDKDLSQVTVRPAGDALKGTPAELLSQRALLSDAFALEDGGSEGKLRLVRLKPKNTDGDFKQIELALDGGTPLRMRFYDQLGGVTEIAFNQVKTNATIDAAQFQFTPPKGVDVVE